MSKLLRGDVRLVGGRFDGGTARPDAPILKVPFTLGTPRPAGTEDVIWMDVDGYPMNDPVPVATYVLGREPKTGEYVYRFESETTAEHWTRETYEAEYARRVALRAGA